MSDWWAEGSGWGWCRFSTWNAESGGARGPCSDGQQFGTAESVRPGLFSGWGCWQTWQWLAQRHPKASGRSVLWWPPLLHFACRTGWNPLLVICLLRKQNKGDRRDYLGVSVCLAWGDELHEKGFTCNLVHEDAGCDDATILGEELLHVFLAHGFGESAHIKVGITDRSWAWPGIWYLKQN